MQNFKRMLLDSFRELKSLRNLCVAAMLTGLCICLGMLRLPIGEIASVSFGFIATATLGHLYGPVTAGMCAGVSDVFSYFLFQASGGPFFPGYTLSAVLGGVIYGMFFYRKKLRFSRVFLAMLTVGVFINLILGSLWVSILYGYGLWGLLPPRILKNALTIPLNSCIFYALSRPLEGVFARLFSGRGAKEQKAPEDE